MELSKKLEEIAIKLRRVREKVDHLEEENGSLRTENEQLKTELTQRTDEAKALQDKLERARRKSKSGSEGAQPELDQEIRQQIDHYISEIDQCIDWLKQQ